MFFLSKKWAEVVKNRFNIGISILPSKEMMGCSLCVNSYLWFIEHFVM